IHAVIGPNGAGKTTYMDLIVNRIAPSSGKVFFYGNDITNKQPYDIANLGICKCFQISKLFMQLTCLENIRIALIHRHGRTFDFLPKASDYLRDEVEAVLVSVGIGHLIDDTAAYLSYGDQRRLEIAITLAMEPKLLMLDEPTAGVSRAEGYAIMDMVRGLVHEKKITVVFIEHDMDIIFNYATRISVMNQGRLIATDTPEMIRQNEFVKEAYFGGKQ
ncbi:MAG TPA: ABC transporter ATP-binding protein, partial [Negativicutes bacterium]|nr:ABC transporter ATP-binding protein [Negativicutes bacterium]